MRRAIVYIAAERATELLRLPRGVDVRDIQYDAIKNEISIVVSGTQLPERYETPEGHIASTLRLRDIESME